MSHDATNWAIKQRGLKPAAKLVLWFLADCHNAHTGQCNPRQSTLAEECEMSRSTVNVHLDALEARGLIRRVVTVDPKSKKQRPTAYILAMDSDFSPVSGNRTPPLDVGGYDTIGCGSVSENQTRTVSGKTQKPCPENRQNRVRNSDTKNLGKEPGTQPAHLRAAAGDFRELVFLIAAAVGRDPEALPRSWMDAAAEKLVTSWLDRGLTPDQIVSAAADSRKVHPSAPHSLRALDGFITRPDANSTGKAGAGALNRNLDLLANRIRGGMFVPTSALTPSVVAQLISSGRVSQEMLA